MAQNIGHQIYVAGFPVKIRTVCAPKLMRGYLFQRNGDFCVFFNQVFNCADGEPRFLQRKEQRVLMPWGSLYAFALKHILQQRFTRFVAEHQYVLLAAFAHDGKLV